MFNSTDFEYDGMLGSTMGLWLCHIDEQSSIPFGVSRKIIEDQNRRNFYFYRADDQPLSFPLTFTLIDEESNFNTKTKHEIIDWFFNKPDRYKLFKSYDNPDICFYVMPTDSSTRYDNGLGQGYITITFRCDCGHAWSNPTTIFRDLTNNTSSGTIVEINNVSNIEDYYLPKIDILLVGSATSFSIQNLTDKGNTFTASGLNTSEELIINMKTAQIQTSAGSSVYRLDNTNMNWLKLVKGVNRLKIIGMCKIAFYVQFPMAV